MKNLQNKKLNTRLYSILLIFLMGGFVFSALFMPSAAKAGIPIIYTYSASLVSKDSFQINGWIDSAKSDAPVKYWFEWGQTESLGNFTYPTTIYTAFPQNISARVVVPDSTALYYFRAAAQNSQGTNFGRIFSFRIPRESGTPNQGANYQPSSGQAPTTAVNPAPTQPAVESAISYPATIGQEIINLSFPNGTKSITSGKSGDIFELAISVKNITNNPLENLIIKNKLSIFLDFVDGSENYKFNKPENEVSWTISKLPPETSANFKIKVRGKRFSENIVIENYVTAINKEVTWNSEKTMILLNIAPLEFLFQAKNENVFAGGISEYEIYYQNKSETALEDAVLQIILPDGIKFEKSDKKFARKDNILTLKIGTLQPEQEGLIKFSATISETAENKSSFTTLATISYQDDSAAQRETLSTYVKNVVDPELAKLMSAALGLQSDLSPTFLVLTLISIIIILVILSFYYYNLYKKQEKRIIFLENKIDDLERKLDKNSSDNIPKNEDVDEDEKEPEEKEEEKARQEIEEMAKEDIEGEENEDEEENEETEEKIAAPEGGEPRPEDSGREKEYLVEN